MPLHHGLHGQGSKVGGLAVLLDGHVDGLITGVVGDAAVHQVDGHLFRGDGGAAAGLTDADDHIGLVCLNGSFQHLTGTDELGGHFLLDDLGTGDGVGQQLHRLKSGVDGLAAKGVETSEQNLHSKKPRFSDINGRLQ